MEHVPRGVIGEDGTDITLPLGLRQEEWRIFRELISSTRLSHPTLQSYKVVRMVVTRFQEIVPTTVLRTRHAQAYLAELRNQGLMDRKAPNKKVYTDTEGKHWQYMTREEIISYFEPARIKSKLIKAIITHRGLMDGYAQFAQNQNTRIAKQAISDYVRLPQTYKTLVLIVTGSQDTLSAEMLEHIGFRKEQITYILLPERSRTLATKKDATHPVFRSLVIKTLLFGQSRGDDFITIMKKAITIWNHQFSEEYGFTFPVQLARTERMSSLSQILDIPDSRWKSILTALAIDHSIWELGTLGTTVLPPHERIHLLLLTRIPIFQKMNPYLPKSAELELTDYTITNGVFRLTFQGISKYMGKYPTDEVQAIVDEVLSSTPEIAQTESQSPEFDKDTL